MATAAAPGPAPASWGTHLWDRAEEVFSHTLVEVGGLATTYAKFYKELAEQEREYARGLRKLCTKYNPKQEVGGQESDRDRGFRLHLTELGYKAGQHELLSELYAKSIPEDLKARVKEANKEIEKLRKELKRSQEVTEHVQKSHEKYNVKYQKSLQEAAAADRSLVRAEADCSLSRREVEKLRALAAEKQRQCEESRAAVARHGSQVAEVREAHLHATLPGLLDTLQGVSLGAGAALQAAVMRGVSAELEADRVVAACTQEMAAVATSRSPHADTERVIEMFKSGAVASEASLDQALVNTSNLKVATNTIRKSKSFAKLPAEKESQSIYQNKRKLESKIGALEEEIAKGHKEMSALQLMVKSYTENPQYGDVTKFRAELDKVTHGVQLLESDLYSLHSQLREVTTQLPGPRVSAAPADTCSDIYTCSDTQSQSSGYPSSASSGDVDTQSLAETSSTRGSSCGDTRDYRDAIQSLLTSSPGYYLPHPSAAPAPAAAISEVEAVEDLPPPPAEMLEGGDVTDGVGDTWSCGGDIVTALYPFAVMAEGNISMAEGEQFLRRGEDEGGWVRVRRRLGDEEGFVPTAFLDFGNS